MKNKSRKSYRLAGWDYSSDGHYFVTICTKNNRHYFGEIIDGEMRLNNLRKMAHQCWAEIPAHFPHVELDEFIVMPNHVHGIIIIKNKPCVRTQNVASNNVGTQNIASNNNNVGTQNIASLQKNYSNQFGPQSKNLASIIRGYKIGVKKFATINNIPFTWQPRFYDRIIRSDKEWYFIQEYILNNPANWNNDKYF